MISLSISNSSVLFVLSLMFGISVHGISQEKKLQLKTQVRQFNNSNQVIENAIDEISKISNAEYILESRHTIPYLPTVFADPVITKRIVSVNMADTVQGAAFRGYVLNDGFDLISIYDGENYLRIDDGERSMASVSQQPSLPYRLLGMFHLEVQTLLRAALDRKADVTTTSSQDSLKFEILFKDLQIEFTPKGIALEKDSVGFNSHYTIYLDPTTFLPLKRIRKMPYQISIETVLSEP